MNTRMLSSRSVWAALAVWASLCLGLPLLYADGTAPGIALHVQPKAEGQANTYATLSAARDAIREHRVKGEWKDQTIIVQIHPGTYYLDETLALGPQDGGTNALPVVYMAAPGDQVTISSGKAISGFKPVEVAGKKLWAVEIPEVKAGKWYFHQLFVNGERRPRTRLPKEGFYRFTGLPASIPAKDWNVGQDQALFKPGDLKKWESLGDVEVVPLTLWVESHLRVADVDEATNTVKFTAKSVFRLIEDEGAKRFARYYVENVFEALDTPGQWYLNRQTGTLYYLPKPGETPEKVTVVAPRLEQVVRIAGEGDKPASDIYFKNLTFSHTEWTLPPDKGGEVQAAFNVPGAIVMAKAARCVVDACRVNQVGGYAVEMLAGCTDCQVIGSELTDLGAGGVKLGHDSSGSTVENNDIGPGGKIYHSAVGVWIGNSGENKVLHNDIHDLYYTGVSVGWSWGYGASKAVKNAIEYNHIYNIGAGLISDMGGIYTLGISPGTTLRYNLIHDVKAYDQGYGGWGIYNDEGSTDIVIENNVVYRTSDGGYHQHYGKENKVRNNIFAFASKSGQIIRSRAEEHTSFIFENNIVYFKDATLLGSNWSNDHYKIDKNVYWHAGGGKVDFAGASFDDWKKRGHDEHSLIADPLFVDPDKGDFTLKPESPAIKLGFKPIEMKGVGRQKKPQ